MLIAPEGTMQRNRKQAPFQTGVGFIVSELGVDVLPIKLEGYGDIWPPPPMGFDEMTKADFKKYLKPKQKGTVVVKIGKKMKFEGETDPEIITRKIETEFNKL